MATKSKRHTHKYHRIDIAGTKVWACALGDCMHYMPKHMESLVNGKNSYCWNCNKQMVLDNENMKMDMPTCFICRNPELSEDKMLEKLVLEKLAGKL